MKKRHIRWDRVALIAFILYLVIGIGYEAVKSHREPLNAPDGVNDEITFWWED